MAEVQLQVLGRDGPAIGEYNGLGQQRTQENLDESRIENW